MASPTYLTFEGDLPNGVNPRRPGISDVGGAAKLDHQTYPPDPITMPTAADENQQERLIVGLCMLSPVAIVQITISAGVPTLVLLGAISTTLLASDFSPVRSSAGVISVTCPATKLPPSLGVCIPVCCQAGDLGLGAVAIANGFTITSYNSAGTATDCNFNLFWY